MSWRVVGFVLCLVLAVYGESTNGTSERFSTIKVCYPEPTSAESVSTEAVSAESVPAESVPAESVPAESVSTEAVSAEAVSAESSASAESVSAELTLSEISSWMPSAADLLRYNCSGADCECRRESERILRAAERLDPTALRMLDSWGKLPPGVLRGNINQLGDFDECQSSGGRYCLVTVDLRLPSSLAAIDSALHAHHAITATVDDPGHRLPRFSLIHWAICVPSVCSPRHLQAGLGALGGATGQQRGLQVRAGVDGDLCQAREDPPVVSSLTSLLGLTFFALILLLCIFGTAVDIIASKYGFILPLGKMQRVLEAFSLPRNVHRLLDCEQGDSEVTALHGVRALNAFGLLMSHKQMALMFLPFINRTDLAEVIGKSWSMIGRSAILYTDSFILLSGLLSARSFLRELSRTGSLNIVDSIISRFIRLTPSLAALIVFCSTVLPSLGSGPMWGLLVNKYARLCHSYWWRNLLFIHNHFPFTEMCLTHSHQVGIDMQLFLLAPPLVYALWRRPGLGALLLVGISVWSSLLRYTVTLSERLATVIYYGVPISQLFKTAEKTYILPSHRATVYCLGIALGYLLHRYRTCKLPPVAVGAGWLVALSCGLAAVFGPYHMSWPGYVYEPQEAALYNAAAPVLWSLFVGWAVLASHYGYGGWFGQFLGWRWFAVFTRLSYAVYLTQFPIFFYNVARTRTSQHYSVFTLVNIPEFAAVMLASAVLTLAVDLPAQNLKKIFLPSITAKQPMTKEEAKEDIKMKELTDKEESVEKRRLPGT